MLLWFKNVVKYKRQTELKHHSAWTGHGAQCTEGALAFTSVSTKRSAVRTRVARTGNGTRLSRLFGRHGRDEETAEDNDGGSYDVKTRVAMKEAREEYIFELAFGCWRDLHEMKFFKKDAKLAFWLLD